MTLFAMLGTTDLLIIAAIALLFFGNRLPGMMRSLGQGVTEFKKGLEGTPDGDAKPSELGSDRTRPIDVDASAPMKSEPAKKFDDQPVKS